MGETAVRGADTPRYNPLIPSFRNVLDSIPNTELLLMDAPPVCIRTLTRSRGCPTSTQHAPPTPPEMKDFRAESDFGASFSLIFGDADLVSFVSSFVVMVGLTSVEEEVAVDIMRDDEMNRVLLLCGVTSDDNVIQLVF